MYRNIYSFEQSREFLLGTFQKRIPELYDPEKYDEVEERLKYEYVALSNISGGEQAFKETSEFVRKLQNLCSAAGHGYKPYITFRGPVLASLIAYLTGISGYDPIAMGFEPWVFYEKPSVIEFNFNLPMRAVQICSDYDLKAPKSSVIYFGRDASVIEEVEECLSHGSVTNGLPGYCIPDSGIVRFFRKAITNKPEWLDILIGFDKEFVPYAAEVLEYLEKINELPSDIRQIAKLDGFLHSSLYDEDHIGMMESVRACSEGKGIYETLISYTEDIYDILTHRGCNAETAKRIARKVKSADRTLGDDDKNIIEWYCGKAYVKLFSDIKHLYCKNQCFQVGLLESKLICLILHHTKLTLEAYDRVRMWQ